MHNLSQHIKVKMSNKWLKQLAKQIAKLLANTESAKTALKYPGAFKTVWLNK